MPTLPFYKVSPSGNTTILLEGLHLSTEQMLDISSKALCPTHLGGEQVGFVDVQKGILRMAGGEFCGNATRALGLLMATQGGCLEPGCSWQGCISTSGFDQPLHVTVKMPEVDNIRHGHDVSLHIPVTTPPLMRELAKGIVLVSLPGISHLLIDAEIYPFSEKHWQENAHDLRKKFALEHFPAVGCLWWQAIKGPHSQHLLCALDMHPVVLVKNPYTLYYENACGSGTLALGLWLQRHSGKEEFYVRQPGGYLSLSLHKAPLPQEGLTAILGGPVHLVAQGQTYFSNV